MKPSAKTIWFLTAVSVFVFLSARVEAHAPGETPTTRDYSPTGGTPGSSADRGENLAGGPGTTPGGIEIPTHFDNPGSGPAQIPVTFTPAIKDLEQKIDAKTKELQAQMPVVTSKRKELDKVTNGAKLWELEYDLEDEKRLVKNNEETRLKILESKEFTQIQKDGILAEFDRETAYSKTRIAKLEKHIADIKSAQSALDTEVKKSAKITEELVFLKQALGISVAQEIKAKKDKGSSGRVVDKSSVSESQSRIVNPIDYNFG